MRTASLSTIAALRLHRAELDEPLATARRLSEACRLIGFDPDVDLVSEEQVEEITIKADLSPPVSRPWQRTNTTPGLIRGIAAWLGDSGLATRTVDSPAFGASQYHPGLSDQAFSPSYVDLQDEDTVDAMVDSRVYALPLTMIGPGSLINVAAVDYDGWGWYAGAIAGLTGCLPGLTMHPAHLFAADPRALAVTLVDLLALTRPALTILELPCNDAHTVSILVGRDPVAIDAMVAHWLGLSSESIPAARLAAEAGLGLGWPEAIDVVGDPRSSSEIALQRQFSYDGRAMIRGVARGLFHPVAGPTLKHFAARCVRCGNCVKSCPGNALALNDHKEIRRATEACWKCLRCLRSCPEGAHRPHFSRLCLWLDRLGRRTCAV